MRELILAFIILLSAVAEAQMKRRYLELELEEVEGATGYHVQVTRILNDGSKKKPFIFKIKNNQWAATLNPGMYELRVRSVDERGVPGEWSGTEVIEVKLQSPSIISPIRDAIVQTNEENSEDVKFEWEKVDGAKSYLFKVYDEAGKLLVEEKTDQTEIKSEFKVAARYEWEVAAVFDDKLIGDFSPKTSFDLYGDKLSEPGQKRIEDINTQLIEWNKVDLAQNYEVLLEKKNENGDWQPFDKKSVTEANLKYEKALETGVYRCKIIAQASKRLDSDPLYQEFKTTYFSNRTPAAIEQIKSEQSYETKSRFFALASYFISVLDYSSKNYDTNNQVAYSAIGGTGRLGAGFWFKEDGMWGVMTTIDMSGFTVANQTQTYLSGQLGAAIRYRLGAVGQLRGLVGVSYRELPTTLATSGFGIPQFTQTKVSSLGPTISVSLARGLTRKLGIQINAAISESTIDMGTPNGRAQEPKMSMQYGLLGSLRLSESFIGFMGYAYREDAASYRANSNPNNNEVTIKGHYLNFMLEYGP